MYDPVRKAVIDASNKCSLQCSKCGREWYRNNKWYRKCRRIDTLYRFEKPYHLKGKRADRNDF